MASLLFQTIEQISREKHIEPEIIVAAIEDAMVVAARKYYRTEEELRSKFNPETGQIDVYSVHVVVEEVADPLREISLADARKQVPGVEVGEEAFVGAGAVVTRNVAPRTLVVGSPARELRPVGDGTELTFTHSRLQDEDSRRSHEDGWGGALDKLQKHLAQD